MVRPETQTSELTESEYEEATFATNEKNESETTTPRGQAPPLEAVAAEEDDDDDNNEDDLSAFLPAAQ